MIVVSGCPRSGTSLMMDILRESLGVKRLVFDGPISGPIDEVSTYIQSKLPKIEDKSFMNPNGFFEMEWTVGGIKYSLDRDEILKNHKGKIVKVVSQGLATSDPSYIEKIIYMLRPPRNVAKSQENLSRDKMSTPKGVKVHSVSMFINVSIAAAHYFIKNPQIPVEVVLFDELQANPIEASKVVSDFIGEDLTKGAIRVDPKLNRSMIEDKGHEGNDWERAQEIYEAMKVKDWGRVINSKVRNHDDHAFYCTRLNKQVNGLQCKRCQEREGLRENFKKHSERVGIDWRNEPCIYECRIKGLSIEKSIKNNHWIDKKESKGLGDSIAKITESVGVKPCGGCKKRKEALNRIFPYKKK